MEAISLRQVSIRVANPPDYSKGMLPISHVEHFARVAQIFADDTVLADLRHRYDLLEKAIASVERLNHPRRPPRTRRAGAAIKIPRPPLADAIATRPQPGPMRTVSIVLLDDHQVVREGVAHFLESHPELKIVGQCGDGLAAVEMIKALAPDFAILDLNHPGLHGLDVIRKLREANCPTKLVVLTMIRDGKTVRDALRVGADGYVFKDSPSRHLLEAIRYVQNGGVYVCGAGYRHRVTLRLHPCARSYAPAHPRVG